MSIPFEDFPSLSKSIWADRYRLKGETGAASQSDRAGEGSPLETFARVARTAAGAEVAAQRELWAERFCALMSDFRFLPAGRILAGAGTGREVTLFNCFVMGTITDSMSGIFDALKESALTLQAGGGIGLDFSTLRPRGAPVASIGSDASGPIGFMDVWDAMCRSIKSAGARRGAMMATLRADHPDIEAFIAAKSEAGRLTNFNLSVLVPDALMQAVADDGDWTLQFDGIAYRTLKARDLWERIMRATYASSEPGVIFIDRVNARSNLSYCETISATNPCGEQPLPPYGACLLGSFNLARYVGNPFTSDARLDEDGLQSDVATAVRLLDNIIDTSFYPLEAQRAEAVAKRRMGLGVTGLADALIFCGLHYDSAEAREAAAKWMAIIQNAAYCASADLAAEKGVFPCFERAAFLAGENVAQLDERVRRRIAENGLRNGCLTSIAPTGTISLFAGNVSSGIEPVFDFSYERMVLQPDGSRTRHAVDDYAWAIWKRERHRAEVKSFEAVMVSATQLSAAAHLEMQAALQPFVDASISKTINCREDIAFKEFETIYLDAYRYGLKGCTTYRPSELRGSVLSHIGVSDEKQLDGRQEAGSSDTNRGERVSAHQAAGRGTSTGKTSSGQGGPGPVALTRSGAAAGNGGDCRTGDDGDAGDGRDAGPGAVPGAGAGSAQSGMRRSGKFVPFRTGQQREALHRKTRPKEAPCPFCDVPQLVQQEGCWICRSCGFSKCA